MQKTLTLPQIVALYIGAVVGSGVLLVPGIAADLSGPASILAWLAMSVLVVPMALTMGLLSARYPDAGGVSHFVRLSYGDRFGHLVGWFFLLSVPIGAPILAVTGAGYVGSLFGWGDWQVYAIASAILLFVVLMNILGLHVAGRVQTLVVALIIAILVLAVVSALPHALTEHFTPFVPHGWLSVFQTAGMLFWCFIGWEAVTHLSQEFENPQRNAIQGVLWSAGVVAVLYFAVAFLTVATHSYGEGVSQVSLSRMIQLSLGPAGGWIVAIIALFICIATANAYVGAASRIAYALARQGMAPRWFGRLHARYQTPVGGLMFLVLCFTAVLALLASKAVSLETILSFPNATFVATYIGGCLAGIKLLRDHKTGYLSSWVSLAVSLGLYPFLGWAALYPLGVAVIYFIATHSSAEVKAKPIRSGM